MMSSMKKVNNFQITKVQHEGVAYKSGIYEKSEYLTNNVKNFILKTAF